jgi:glycosyltransferase involved in cell wall biosynthesis
VGHSDATSDASHDDPVTVVTVTQGRPERLRQAVRSVREQDYAGPIEHLLLIDDDDALFARVQGCVSPLPSRSLVASVVRRPESERDDPHSAERCSVYPRLSRMFNLGAQRASGAWIAYLDDDNEYLPNHLRSLRELAAQTGSPAVHSARAMVWPDGSPYLTELFPGAPNPDEGRRLHALMCEREAWVRGTNILKDRVDPGPPTFRNSTVMSADDPIFLVDQSLWLLRRELVLTFPFPTDFTPDEIRENTCPDDKFLECLVRNDVHIVSSERATVRYCVGGISNGDEQADR